jgi:hypothetical protein
MNTMPVNTQCSAENVMEDSEKCKERDRMMEEKMSRVGKQRQPED